MLLLPVNLRQLFRVSLRSSCKFRTCQKVSSIIKRIFKSLNVKLLSIISLGRFKIFERNLIQFKVKYLKIITNLISILTSLGEKGSPEKCYHFCGSLKVKYQKIIAKDIGVISSLEEKGLPKNVTVFVVRFCRIAPSPLEPLQP